MYRALVLLLVLVILLTARTSAHDPITTKVTWSREISRIVERRCAGCHRPDGVAPMPLTSYEQIRPWVKAVKEEVVSRRMPKWPAARGVGDFENDRSLSPFEVELIAAWVDGGAPKGDSKHLSKPSSDAKLPKAGMTLKLPARHAAPAGERRTFEVATSASREQWVTGWTFRTNDPAIVQAEFAVASGGYLGTWVPPEDVVLMPNDAGVRLPAAASITVTIWYRSEKAQLDFPVELPRRAPELGLIVTSTRPSREARVIEASCGETIARDAGEIFAIRPVNARPRAPMGLAIRRAGGPPRLLAWLREFDPSYQATYRLRDAVAIEAGAQIEVASDDASCKAIVQYAVRRADLSGPPVPAGPKRPGLRTDHSTATTNATVTTTPRR
jgi:hypothetical protein